MGDRVFITSGDGLPKWSNPVSHAVVVNGMCFISGQLSIDLNGEYVQGTIEEETNLAFRNLLAVAKSSGFVKEEIVYVDIAFSSLSDMNSVNQIYMNLFPETRRPARTIYQAAALPFNAKIKIVATAVKSSDH